jgi:small-conductance mechanosensitive channel
MTVAEEEFLGLFSTLWYDLQQPDNLWQVGALLICILGAWMLSRLIREKASTDSEAAAMRFGSGGVRRIALPLSAMLLISLAILVLKPWTSVALLRLAMPIFSSLAVVRMVVYVLRHAFAPSGMLAASERFVSALVWGVVVLHLTGLLPGLIAALESVSFPIGKEPVTLWMVLRGGVMVFATVIASLWVAGLIEKRLDGMATLDSSVRVVLGRVAKALLTLLAVLFSLSLVGIDVTALSVFGGALGVGLGFGLQKIASNYFSGFIILLDRSVKLGNVIMVDAAVTGIVTRITTRYTVVRTLSGVEYLVPNEQLVSTVVQNHSHSDSEVRLSTQVQVAYSADLPAVLEMLRDIALTHPRVLAEPAPKALVVGFADSGINLELGFWISDPEQGTGGIRSDINLEVWKRFKAAGIEIPFPQREVRLLGQTPPGANA